MPIGRKPKHHCEAEACISMANKILRRQGRPVHLCERHYKVEKNDPGAVEIIKLYGE